MVTSLPPRGKIPILPNAILHPDPDVRALTAAAIAELPDVTTLLILADRFGELADHRREHLARSLAANLSVTPRPLWAFGANRLLYACQRLDRLTGVRAAWLTAWNLPAFWYAWPPMIRVAALATLDLQVKAFPAFREDNHLAERFAAELFRGEFYYGIQTVLDMAEGFARTVRGGDSPRVRMLTRHQAGACIELASGLSAFGLAAIAKEENFLRRVS